MKQICYIARQKTILLGRYLKQTISLAIFSHRSYITKIKIYHQPVEHVHERK